ncbi:nucleotidyltransferase domain-containing protein [Saccharibacillus alkalitolerans]|uniref:Polymerase nucleotidyl transferase domain-containing protein n=1 Tax=Saccharibacillus alkalitolerans TaxID=2705290 RepID=A0ABX0FBS3_9BACL|nr:hypothetical protein [Saccharibacillus alkalitolerans]NGZ77728.1 hypothetical protein [Saccharibacillus alkalitolerans]
MDKFNVFDVSSALIERVRRDYAEDVAIAAYYGSYLDGTATDRSDLDFFFIPAKPEGYQAGLSFILNGISFDFWPVSWERAEKMARLEDGQAGILADCKLLYVRSDEDLERFNNLKLQLKDIRSFEGEEAFLGRAEEKLNGIYPVLHELRRAGTAKPLSGYRLRAFEVMAPLFEAIALLNRTYLRKGWGKNLTQLYDLPIRPNDLEPTVGTILRSADTREIVEGCERLADAVKLLISERRRSLQPPTADYAKRGAGFFEEFKGLLDKVQTACERQDYELAFFAAVHAESELNGFLVFCETGRWGSGEEAAREGRKIAEQAKLPALVPLLDPANLIPLQSAAHWLEISLERYLNEKGVEIRKFGSLPEFRRFLLGEE